MGVPAAAGRAAILVLSGTLAYSAAIAQAPHYPGAWLDREATGREMAAAAQRGIASVAVYGSGDRIERVDAFYRQYFQALPATGPGARFCLDRVMRPEDCRRFLEVWEAAGGCRMRSYELR